MSVLTITLGETTQLQVKVPSKGETDWSESFKTEFAQKIVVHDHTGVDGKGAKISTAKLEDNAVTTAKITDLNVTTAKIADLNVATAKLANNSVTNAKMGTDIPLSTLSNVSSTSPTTGQVLKWSGTEWEPGTDQVGTGVGSITTIANQTEANSYSPSEGDTLKITSNVTFTDVTFNKIKIYIDDSITLTFNSSDINDCYIVGGNLICKGTSSHSDDSNVQTTGIDSFSIKRTQIYCEDVSLEQDLSYQTGRVQTTVENVVFDCYRWRYQVDWTNDAAEVGDGTNYSTTSSFDKVTIFSKISYTPSGTGNVTYAVADYSDMLVSTNINSIRLNTSRELAPEDTILAIGDDYETGSRTNILRLTTTSV